MNRRVVRAKTTASGGRFGTSGGGSGGISTTAAVAVVGGTKNDDLDTGGSSSEEVCTINDTQNAYCNDDHFSKIERTQRQRKRRRQPRQHSNSIARTILQIFVDSPTTNPIYETVVIGTGSILIVSISFMIGYFFITPLIIVQQQQQQQQRSPLPNQLQHQEEAQRLQLPSFPKVWRPDPQLFPYHNHRPATTIASSASLSSSPISLSEEVLGMCTNTLWHTIETTTIVLPHYQTFVHTGDIDDLWIRDSCAQLHTLVIPIFSSNDSSDSDPTTTTISGRRRNQSLIAIDPQLHRIVGGLINRIAFYIHHDPYANAFRIDDTYPFTKQQRHLGRHDYISTWN